MMGSIVDGRSLQKTHPLDDPDTLTFALINWRVGCGRFPVAIHQWDLYNQPMEEILWCGPTNDWPPQMNRLDFI